jgi:hypothetical protein
MPFSLSEFPGAAIETEKQTNATHGKRKGVGVEKIDNTFCA